MITSIKILTLGLALAWFKHTPSLGQEAAVEATYILINGQEFEKYDAPLPGYSVPVLIFVLKDQNNWQTDIELVKTIDMIGHRRLQLLKDSDTLAIWHKNDAVAVIVDLTKLGSEAWRKIIAAPYESYVARNKNDSEMFLAGQGQDSGEYRMECFSPIQSSEKRDVFLDWDNMVISPKPRYTPNKGPVFLMIYDAERKGLVRYLGNKYFPLHDSYPSDLIDKMSQEKNETRLAHAAGILRNEDGQRLIVHSSSATQGREFYALDDATGKWNTMVSAPNMAASSSGACLCLSEFDPAKSEEEIVYTGKNVFYSLPDLNERFRWNANQKWELLTIDGTSIRASASKTQYIL